MNCNLCGADDSKLLYPGTLDRGDAPLEFGRLACTSDAYGIHPPIVRCRQCGLVYANPRPGTGDLIHGYAAIEDSLYLAEREGRELTFRRHLDHLQSWIALDGRRRLLDVGCHIGVFLEEAQARGWDAWGVEPSEWAVSFARERELNVVQGTLADVAFPPDHFDVVTLWDVIEHLPDPMDNLRRVAHLVRAGGWVCIHTMDVESLFARAMGSRWPWLMEMHLYYFSRNSLRVMLERAGFRVIHASARGRVLRLGYVTSRLVPYSRRVAGSLKRGIEALGLAGQPIPVNLGDLVTVYARKG